MNHIKSMCKDPVKVDQKLSGKQFLLGKYFNLKANCNRCKKDKKFIKSKRQKLLQIQHQINQQQFIETSKNQLNTQKQKQLRQVQIKQINSNLIEDEKQELKNKTGLNHQFPQLNYEYFLPLHKLWKGYMHDLISFEKNQQSACLKILRSDFVGAQIQVVYSKVSSYIGQRGIIIKQTLKSFVVIKTSREQDNRKCSKQIIKLQNNLIPKKGLKKNIINLLKNEIIFTIEFGQKSYLVNGNTLVYRPSDRSKHKFKFRIGEQLNLNFLGNFIEENNILVQ